MELLILGAGAQEQAAGAAGRPLQGEAWDAPCWTQPVPEGYNKPTAGQSWASQPRWWHLRENMFKKGQKTLERQKRGGGKSEKQQKEHQGQRRKRRRSSMSPEQISSATHGALNPKAVERCERKGGAERKHYVLTISHTTAPRFVSLVTSLKR